MNNCENKLINLVLKRCVNFNHNNSLLIHLDLEEHLPIAEKFKQKALELGVEKVEFCVTDVHKIHDYLKNTKTEDIKLMPFMDRQKWDEYAKNGAPILFFHTECPGLMADIPVEKIQKWTKLREQTIKYYRANVSKHTFPWTIIGVPNKAWAKHLFPNNENSYELLQNLIYKMCMADKDDPVKEWNSLLNQNQKICDKLNALKATKFHYTNSLGTNLYVEKLPQAKWVCSNHTDLYGGQMISNMPSYEIFSTLNKYKTNGVLVATKPMIYAGQKIENFKLLFIDGQVAKFTAQKGLPALDSFLNNNKNAKYLGEIAFVPFNSPISQTNVVYESTLFDENASCHFALGDGFPSVFEKGNTFSEEDCDKHCINISNVHQDFMIGTKDLSITAETKIGKIKIFENGNFAKEFLELNLEQCEENQKKI